MSVKNTHPSYDAMLPHMQMVRNFYDGEKTVKDAGQRYLKPTVSQTIDGLGIGMPGLVSYEKYKEGARFPDLVKQAVENSIGLMHKGDATITVPAKMEPLLERITSKGESVYQLIRRVNEEQLIAGRVGLLLDADEATDQPYISMYYGESITNWNEGILDSGNISSLKMAILNEPTVKLDNDFKWIQKDMFRVLSLMPVGGGEGGKQIYQTGLFEDVYNPSAMAPVLLTGRPLEEIPFVFVNTKDILPSPDLPPLLGLAYAVLGIYRSEANYRYHLYMQSQDSLVRIGFMGNKDQPLRTGAGALIDLEIGGDAKYIGVNSNGLPEERTALENDYARAEKIAMQLLADKKAAESNDALLTRISSQTASLTQIAKTSAAAVEKMLRMIAVWMQLNPDEVKVTPFTDFIDATLPAKEIIDMMTAKTMGAPISQETVHERMREGGLTDKTLQEELEALATEDGGE